MLAKVWPLALLCCGAFGQEHKPLTVAAAANLTDVFAEIATKFQTQTGIAVVYSFGATANLAMQAEHAAPFDVFAAADVAHVEQLDKEGLLVAGSKAVYARGRLVLWMPPASRAHVSRVEDLKDDDVKIVAIANPKLAPYGAAAVESLHKLGLWSAVEPKVVYAETISAAKQFAATGNADAAFTAYSLVLHSGGNTIEIPGNLHAPIDQAVAILRSSDQQGAARQFVQFLLGAPGREMLERYGYELPR
ncbi:MAG: molybdate ABC transporter substrate-binding protein [Bryobacteraceae bacterium]